MRESGGRIVLMDFGAGRHVKESKVSDLSGTPLYLAPELFTGQSGVGGIRPVQPRRAAVLSRHG